MNWHRRLLIAVIDTAIKVVAILFWYFVFSIVQYEIINPLIRLSKAAETL